MTITLQSIQFRIPGADNGAFNISLPGNNGGPRTIISGPEWQQPDVRLPAAFAKQEKPPLIDVDFLCSDMNPVQAQIQATAVNGHVLGDIAPFNATFENGRFAGRIALNAAHINGVGHSTIQWNWRITAEEQTFACETTHEIYTTIDQPADPWETAGTDPTAAPWKEALDKSCEWANGAAASDEILNVLSDHHYHSGLLQYGSNSYAEGGIFKLDKFLADQFFATIRQVDCADCATITAIFGGLLGAKFGHPPQTSCLVVVLDAGSAPKFETAASTILVGGEVSAPAFNNHEAVWSIGDPDNTLVWDFCLGRSVSGQAEPYTDLRFHNPASIQTTYPVEAFIPVTAGALKLLDVQKRQIKDTALIFNLRQPIDSGRFGFGTWRNRSRDFVGLAFLNFVPVALGAIRPIEIWRYQKQPKPWLVDTVYNLGPETIQVGVFECDSRDDAHLTLFHLLEAQRVLPLLELRAEPIGDVLFYDSDNKSDLLLFARGNLVVRLQRNRGSETALLQLAQIIDNILVHGLATLREAAPAAAGIVRESFPVHLPGVTSTVRFFSNAAEIVLSGATPTLRNA